MKLETNKYYVTKAGYVVFFAKKTYSLFTAHKKFSPGVNTSNGSTSNNLSFPEDGWFWTEDCNIYGLDKDWNDKLTIVGELPCKFPDKLPEGYQWAGGFPQFRNVKIGEYYLTVDGHGNPFNIYTCTGVGVFGFPNSSVLGGKRFIVESTTQQVESPIQADNTSQQYTVAKESMGSPRNIPSLPFGYEFTANPPEYRLPKKGELYMVSGCTSIGTASYDYAMYKCFIIKKKASVELEIPQINEAPLFEKPDFIKMGDVKPSANLFAYWVTEPIVNMITFGKRSFRYVVMLSVISGAGYTAYNPQVVKKSIEKCIPKVNIEFKKNN